MCYDFPVFATRSAGNPLCAFKHFHNDAASAILATLRKWFEHYMLFIPLLLSLSNVVFGFVVLFFHFIDRYLFCFLWTLLSDVFNFFRFVFLSEFPYSVFSPFSSWTLCVHLLLLRISLPSEVYGITHVCCISLFDVLRKFSFCNLVRRIKYIKTYLLYWSL